MTQHMQREIEKLKKKILALSALVETSVQRAAQSLAERNAALAAQVIDTDFEIDQAEIDVEEECLKILALYQPVAGDLRFVIAVLKINNDLERVGDLAVNIAERAVFLSQKEPVEIPFDLTTMAEKSQSMLRHSLDALMAMDTGIARAVTAADDEVDELNRQGFTRIHEAITRNPQRVEEYVNLLSVSRHLERIADYATNIAEDVIYMINGEIVRHRAEIS